jgi:hypothetical protein
MHTNGRLALRGPAALGSIAALLLAAGCSGSDSPPPPPALPAGVPFTLSGIVTYDFVPTTLAGGLAFGNAVAKPVRNARLEVRQGATVLASTTTNALGTYTITFTPGPEGALVVAALAETSAPPIRVMDNTAGNAVWAVGDPIDDASPVRDIHATHGWTGASYDAGRRIAAPFAILDSMYTAARKFIDLPDRTVTFPLLKVHWSPSNTTQPGNTAAGLIGTSHYRPGLDEIYILGHAGVDTDEFDAHVIVHEWGHYFEDNLSRSDSPGGQHGAGDLLDPRLSFGEGYGTALASMLLPEPLYMDTMWLPPVTGPLRIGIFADVENVSGDDPPDPLYPSLNPGPFSEMSIIRVLYDLFDPANEDHDQVALGLRPIYDTLVGPQRTTDALTTIASFITGLKAHPDVDAAAEAAIDALLFERGIGPITTQWGDGDAKLSAMFTDLTIGGAAASVTLDGRYFLNNQPQVRFFVFTPAGTGATVRSFSEEDVDVYVYRNGQLLAFSEASTGNEVVPVATVAGVPHVVELLGWGGLPSGTQVNEYAASVTVTQP